MQDGGGEAMDVYRAGSVEEMQAALGALGRREAAVTARLDSLLARQKEVRRQLSRLDVARAQLGAQVVATRAMESGMLAPAADTARRISGAVRRLDCEQTNVRATLDVVEQVVELKGCVLGLHASMGAAQDWETAADYLHRATTRIPAAVIDSPFADEMVPTADVPDPPRHTLNAAAESLCGLFLREFDKAARAADGSRIARFFKLFPLIGRSDVGLDAYGRYVCAGIAARARANMTTTTRRDGLFYATALTKLFEHIAEIVDGHEPLVERHYGPGSMVKVIQRIQVEADVQGGIILDTWAEEREVARKRTDVKSYPFNFLAQGLLSSQKQNLPPSGRGSPAPASGRTSEDDVVDTKDVDALLNESAIMLGRWSLYTRFLASKISSTPSATVSSELTGLTVPSFIANSTLQKKIHQLLIEPFLTFATFFFRRAVERAFQLDEHPADLSLNPNKPLGFSPPFITSAVDDVMYNAQQIIQRTLSTSQRTLVAGVIPGISRVLGSDFYGIIQRKMRDEAYPRPAIQGAIPPEGLIIQFLVLMNNLDVSTDYVKRIVTSCIGSPSSSPAAALSDSFPFDSDAVFVEKTLHSLEHGFASKTSDLIDDAIEVLIRRVIRPRLIPVLNDAFRDVDYDITTTSSAHDSDTSPYSENDDLLVASRFDRGWHAFMLPLKRLLTPSNAAKLLAAAIPLVATSLEKRVWALYARVSALGAVRLERDVSGIMRAAVRGGAYELRRAFARVGQICVVMVMEEDEWRTVEGMEEGEELERVTGIREWMLDGEERRRARGIVKG